MTTTPARASSSRLPFQTGSNDRSSADADTTSMTSNGPVHTPRVSQRSQRICRAVPTRSQAAARVDQRPEQQPRRHASGDGRCAQGRQPPAHQVVEDEVLGVAEVDTWPWRDPLARLRVQHHEAVGQRHFRQGQERGCGRGDGGSGERQAPRAKRHEAPPEGVRKDVEVFSADVDRDQRQPHGHERQRTHRSDRNRAFSAPFGPAGADGSLEPVRGPGLRILCGLRCLAVPCGAWRGWRRCPEPGAGVSRRRCGGR